MAIATSRVLDLLHLGRRSVLGTWVVDDEYLIDVGPTSTVPHLLDALGGWRPRAIVLTHIHLDHAGGTGTLLERWPDVEVWVHAGGAPHLVDPSRLWKSAGRIFGPDLERLWGVPEPVPAGRIRTIDDGERAGPFRAVATPGHAGSHLALDHPSDGIVYCGDAAGVRIAPATYVFPPTVPPELDVEAWKASIDRIAACRPRRLAIGHFGAFDDCDAHLERLRQELDAIVREGRRGRDAYTAWVGRGFGEVRDPEFQEAYRDACNPAMAWAGLERYLRREER
jgi:glyoxylase-like metal-dependent hydrolase (beta-lactamase superfamily II)